MLIELPTAILTNVRNDRIYDDTAGKPAFSDALILGVHSRTNEPLRLQLLVDNTQIFANVPVSALTNRTDAVKLTEPECVHGVFGDEKISIAIVDWLTKISPCQVLNRDGSVWRTGNYVLTVEWEKIEAQLHLIELDDGNYCFWGNEDLRWGSDE